MVYNIFTYRRPAYVHSFSSASSSADSISQLKPLDGSKSHRGLGGIPDWLSFDRIISNTTCPPVTCRDFLNYLLYVEHGAENLQFYLWYRDYAKRFGKLPQRERELSAEYTHTPVTAGAPLSPLPDTWKPGTSKIPGAVQQFISDAFAQESAKSDPRATVPQLAVPAPAWAPGSEYREESPLFTPLRTPPPPPKSGGSGASGQSSGSNPPFSENNQPLAKVNYKQAASEAFEAVEHKWQPFSIQPFRDEISRIIALYLAEGSPRELNLSDRDRKVVLKALAQTTHPSAMEHVKARVEALLRFQSHPNFIRWSICNVNRPRRVCAICMGTVCILLGLAASIAITMGRYARGWRALGAFGWLIGGATLFAGTKGMCVVLNGRHRRQVRPWELWVDTRWESEMRDPKASIETAKSNSYEDEPWVEKHKQRNLIRRLFDREAYIEEPALRQAQDTIVLQAVLLAALGSALLSALFVALPHGGRF